MDDSRDPATLAKAGILSPQAAVRSFALNYFSGSFGRDPSVLPIALQAVGQYGVADAFPDYSWLSRLPQNEESFGLLLAELQRTDLNSADLRDYRRELHRALLTSTPSSLVTCLAETGTSPWLDEEVRLAISDRVRLFSLEPPALWIKAEQFCDSLNIARRLSQPQELFLQNLSDSVAHHGKALNKKLSAALREAFGGRRPWLEILAVMVVGKQRAEARARWIIPRLQDLDEVLVERCMDSLIKIGCTSTIRSLVRYFPIANNTFRSQVAFILGHIHSDESIRTCLRLLRDEIDREVEMLLLEALLRNLATEGVRLAREFMRHNLQRNELVHLCQAAATLLGIEIL